MHARVRIPREKLGKGVSMVVVTVAERDLRGARKIDPAGIGVREQGAAPKIEENGPFAPVRAPSLDEGGEPVLGEERRLGGVVREYGGRARRSLDSSGQ
jgi:hypothetical protein